MDSRVGVVMDKIKEKFHGDDSSDSEGESVAASKIYRLFGRERPLHDVLGGGKPADVFLWRNRKISAGVLGGATLVWVMFELLDYYLLTLVCHCLVASLAIVFLWSNASGFFKKSPPPVPVVSISENHAVNFALALRFEINRALAVLRSIALGHDLKKLLAVIGGLWVLSIIGSCCNFLTLFYIVFVLLHMVPLFYEKYEDKIDAVGEKAMLEFRKQYAVFDAKVLSKIPKGPLKDKRH